MAYLPALIDTDILSELFKGHASVKANAAVYVREHNLLTISHITKYEILKGLKAKKGGETERGLSPVLLSEYSSSNH